MALITNLYSALAQEHYGESWHWEFILYEDLRYRRLILRWNICTRWMYQCNPYYKGSQSFVTLFALVGGMLAGLVTGWLHTELMIPAILVF